MAQAWLIGTMGRTAIDLAALSVTLGLPEGFVHDLPDAIRDILLASMIPFVVGLGLVSLGPAFTIRNRLSLCGAMVASVTGTAAALVGFHAPKFRIIVALVFLDIALAALWCWHRTKGMQPTQCAHLAKVFK